MIWRTKVEDHHISSSKETSTLLTTSLQQITLDSEQIYDSMHAIVIIKVYGLEFPALGMI